MPSGTTVGVDITVLAETHSNTLEATIAPLTTPGTRTPGFLKEHVTMYELIIALHSLGDN